MVFAARKNIWTQPLYTKLSSRWSNQAHKIIVTASQSARYRSLIQPLFTCIDTGGVGKGYFSLTRLTTCSKTTKHC